MSYKTTYQPRLSPHETAERYELFTQLVEAEPSFGYITYFDSVTQNISKYSN